MAENKLLDLLGKTTFEDVIGDNVVPKVDISKPADISLPSKEELEAIERAKVKVSGDDPGKDGQEGVDGSDEQSLYEGLNKILGYQVEGEFDESVEGVAEYTKLVGQQIAQEEIKDLFESFPDVKEYLQFRLNNGDPVKYFESKYGDVDYSKYQVDEKDETTQEVIVRKYLQAQGFKEDDINETVKDYKDTGLLYKTAKKAAERLVDSQKTKRESIIANQAEKAKEAEGQREEMIAEITDVVDKGNLHNIVIPEKDRKEFKQWLLQPDGKGVTKRQATMAKLTMAQKLELEYLAFKGFDLKDLVRREAAQTKIDFLKKSTGAKSSRLGGIGKDVTGKKGVSDLSGLKFTDIV